MAAFDRASAYRLTTGQRVAELVRPWSLLAVFVVLAAQRSWLLATAAAVGTFLAGFVQMHDTAHNALGLSKRTHAWLLSLSALLLLKSGHGMKATHMRHHGKCLGAEDAEGAPANWSLRRVLFAGPFHVFALRAEGLRLAPRTRTRQLLESAATVGVLAGAVALWRFAGSPAGLLYWAVAAGLSCAMPLWGAYLPHRLAARHPAIRTARRWAQVWTPVMSSFAYHHVHHRHPGAPTALLPVLAAQLGTFDEEGDDHDHDHHAHDHHP